MSNILDRIAYCGLYCGLCTSRNRIPKQAQAIIDSLKKEGIEFWGSYTPNFNEFWSYLSNLSNNDDPNGGCSCRDGTGGPPFCGIRKCAKSKDIDVCFNCSEFPCYRIEGLAKGYTMLLSEAKRFKEIGINAWVEEQEKRKCTGFCYSDIRCEPYEIATD